MGFARTLSKDTIIKRLEFILKKYSIEMLEFDLAMVFDDELWTLWENGHFINHRFPEIETNFDSKYLIRNSIIKKIKRLNKKIINESELKNIFEDGDEFVLGPFLPSGDKNDIVSKMNYWYFNSFGNDVFKFDKKSRVVPNMLSIDPLFEKANANYLYNKIKSGSIKVNEIKILKLANGYKVEAHRAFFEEIKKLDNENGTNVYSRLKYIITDFSSKIVQDVKNKCLRVKELNQAHKDGTIKFEVFDALSGIDNYEKDLSVIDTSYLFDSISSPIIIKRGNELYHVYIRGVISDKYKISDRNGKKIPHKVFKNYLIKNDFNKLSKIEKRAFNLIRIEIKLVKTETNKFSYSKQLNEFCKDHETALFSLNMKLINLLEDYKKVLVRGGYFQSFDYGILDFKKMKLHSKLYQRYTGNVTLPINYTFLKILGISGMFNINIENSITYLNKSLNDKVIFFPNLNNKTTTFEIFAKFFDFNYLTNFNKLKQKSEELLTRYGYSEEGNKKFNEFLNKSKLLEWKDKKWVDLHYNKKDYLFDYLNGLFLHFKFYVLNKYKELWLFEDLYKDTELIKSLINFGYDKEVIKNIFKFYNEIEEVSYVRLEMVNK